MAMSNQWVEFLQSELVNEEKGGNLALLSDLNGMLYGVCPAGGEDSFNGENFDMNLILQCFGDQCPGFVHLNGIRYNFMKKQLLEDNRTTACILQQNDGNGDAIFVSDLTQDDSFVLIAACHTGNRILLMQSIMNAFDNLR
jgi:hypothetical protein